MSLPDASSDPAKSVLIRGMHGLGDNIHQRAVIRALLKRNYQIKLETSWPCVYHDMPIQFLRKPVALRTQLKNSQREAAKFAPPVLPHHTTNTMQISYTRQTISRTASQSVLEAMFVAAGLRNDYAEADFSLPIPKEWFDAIPGFRKSSEMGYSPLFEGAPSKPMMIYRPLVARPEWRGSSIRNAHESHYAELVGMVRDTFFVVSVADLEENREWIVGPQLKADLTFNHGELSFEAMAALFSRAALVFTSNGFPAVLAPAVGTPTISIMGGYEPSSWLRDGAKLAPYLGIDTMNPCSCGSSACTKACNKLIDMPRARAAVAEFSAKLGFSLAAESRPIGEMFAPAVAGPLPQHRAREPRVMPRVRVGHPSLLTQRKPPVRA